MSELNILPDEAALKQLCQRYRYRTDGKPEMVSVFNTFICGNLHTYPKRAKAIIDECKHRGFVKIKQGRVFVMER